MDAVVALPSASLTTAAACAALGLSRASVHRRRSRLTQLPVEPAHRRSPPRALSAAERRTVLDLLREPRFVDLAPAEIYATLLDEDIYHGSIRTLYRILDDNNEVRERRDQLRHPVHSKPELLAEGPDQVWSWDITKLKGPAKWTYFYLYVWGFEFGWP
jgi:transposase InsO family protein